MQFGESIGGVSGDIVGAAGYGPPGGGGPPGYGGPPSGGPPGFGVPPGGGGGYGPPGVPPGGGGYGGGAPPGGYGGGPPPGGYGGGAPPGGYGGGPPNPYGGPPGGPPMMGGYGPGAPMGGPMQGGTKMNVLSLLSLISGGLSVPGCLCWCIPFSNTPFAIAGIVMGILALNQVKASNGMQTGKPMAIIGIVGGGIGLLLAILAFVTTWDDAITSGFHSP